MIKVVLCVVALWVQGGLAVAVTYVSTPAPPAQRLVASAGPQYQQQYQPQTQTISAAQYQAALAAAQQQAQYQAAAAQPQYQAAAAQPQYQAAAAQPQYQAAAAQPQYQAAAAQPQYQAATQPQYQAPQPQYRAPQQPAARPGLAADPEDYDPNPQYQFAFDVRDDQFTNYQNRKEQREGDKISGSYSVVDADGFIRTVKYTADPLQGFKAQVTREPTDIVVKYPTPTPPPAAQPLSIPARPQYLQAAAYQQAQQQQHQQQVEAAEDAEARQRQLSAAGLGVLPPGAARPRLAGPAKAVGYSAQQPGQPPVVYQAYQQ